MSTWHWDEEHLFTANPACGADGTSGWTSMRCRARYAGCEDLACVCVCHNPPIGRAVSLAELESLDISESLGLIVERFWLNDIVTEAPRPPAPLTIAELQAAFAAIEPIEPQQVVMNSAHLEALRQMSPPTRCGWQSALMLPGYPVVIDETADWPRLEPIPQRTTDEEDEAK